MTRARSSIGKRAPPETRFAESRAWLTTRICAFRAALAHWRWKQASRKRQESGAQSFGSAATWDHREGRPGKSSRWPVGVAACQVARARDSSGTRRRGVVYGARDGQGVADLLGSGGVAGLALGEGAVGREEARHPLLEARLAFGGGGGAVALLVVAVRGLYHGNDTEKDRRRVILPPAGPPSSALSDPPRHRRGFLRDRPGPRTLHPNRGPGS